MRRGGLYLLFGVVAYGVALVATVPAGFAYDQYRQHGNTAGVPLDLHGLNGTLWAGGAEQVVIRDKVLGKLDWRISPWALLLGKADIDWRLSNNDGYVQGNLVVASSGSAHLQDTEGQLPVRQLTVFSPFMPVVAEGTVSLRIEEAAIAGGVIEQADGRVVWHQAALAAPAAMKLGDLSMAIAMDDGVLVGSVTDHGGPLQVGGKVTLQPEGRYNVDLRLAAQAGADDGLKSGLSMLGRADAQGRHHLRYQGKF